MIKLDLDVNLYFFDASPNFPLLTYFPSGCTLFKRSFSTSDKERCLELELELELESPFPLLLLSCAAPPPVAKLGAKHPLEGLYGGL